MGIITENARRFKRVTRQNLIAIGLLYRCSRWEEHPLHYRAASTDDPFSRCGSSYLRTLLDTFTCPIRRFKCKFKSTRPGSDNNKAFLAKMWDSFSGCATKLKDQHELQLLTPQPSRKEIIFLKRKLFNLYIRHQSSKTIQATTMDVVMPPVGV